VAMRSSPAGFELWDLLQQAGNGEVYEAEDVELREVVAIKCIIPDALKQPDALTRFRREVNLARRVTHPNVCRIFDLFRHSTQDGNNNQTVAFVSMELLRGDTLALRISQKGRFGPEEALPIITQLAEGLDAAHRAGVVHRDFKPGNIILVGDAKSKPERVVITDFGVALRSDRESPHSLDRTIAGEIVGTPA
jgi:eukaryotic-like serine/threonine-protein kinase